MRSLLLMAALAAAVSGAEPIARRPDELHFAAREFTPPEAAQFRHKLSNGATAFLVEDHEFPLINISVLIKTGSYLDPAGKDGLAALVGHQMSAGGAGSRTPAAFEEESAFLAAQIRSGVGDFEGDASLNCLTKDIDSGLALFINMLRRPRFDEARLALAKSQMLQSLERRNDSTASIEQREFARLLRGDKHFSTRPVTKASLASIARQDLIDFHGHYYYPSNFVLAVSGDFDTPQMLAKLEQALGGWQNREGRIPDPPAPDFTPKPGVYVVNKKDVNQARVRLGHAGVSFRNPDHIALEVMNGMLGGNSFTSHIFARIRTDEGLAYSAGSSFTPGTFYDGLFLAAFQSKSPSAAQAAAIVLEEMRRMQTGTVSREELETAISHAVETFPVRFSTARQKAGQFASDYYSKRPEDYWRNYRRRVSAVTAADVQRVARQYLHPDDLVILVVGDVETILRGNPDRPQYSIAKLAGSRGITRIPLPDPLTMVYPAN